MRIFVLITALSLNFLYADIKTSIYRLYQDKSYKKACQKGLNVFHKYRKDEEFVSLYAFSCLKADYIDRLSIPIAVLHKTKESRSNAAYFSVILMQKKLLYHSLIDGYRLNALKLPTTDNILSIVYELYSSLENKTKQNSYILKDSKNEKISYKLYIKNSPKAKKMVIEEHYDKIMTHRHIYW